MKLVILAGGYGTRLGTDTEFIPKPMVTIGDQPIIWHIMKIYSHYGIRDFVICLGYKGQVIRDYFSQYAIRNSDATFDLQSGQMTLHKRNSEDWRVTLVETGLDTQTGGRLKRVRDYVGNDTFCFTYGDGLSNIPVDKLLQFHKNHKKSATVTAVIPPARWGIIKSEGAQVIGFSEKVESTEALINGGYFVLEPNVFDAIADDTAIWEQDPLRELTAKRELMAFQHFGFWQCMDNPRERRDLEKMWASGKAPWKVWD